MNGLVRAAWPHALAYQVDLALQGCKHVVGTDVNSASLCIAAHWQPAGFNALCFGLFWCLQVACIEKQTGLVVPYSLKLPGCTDTVNVATLSALTDQSFVKFVINSDAASDTPHGNLPTTPTSAHQSSAAGKRSLTDTEDTSSATVEEAAFTCALSNCSSPAMALLSAVLQEHAPDRLSLVEALELLEVCCMCLATKPLLLLPAYFEPLLQAAPISEVCTLWPVLLYVASLSDAW